MSPMKSATNAVAGRSYIASGASSCSIFPLAITAMRSDIAMRLLLVVGHVDEGDSDVRLQALQLDLHLLAQLQVERAQRLVEQEHTRAHDERARQRDALLLAARELARPARLEPAQLHELERLACKPIALALGRRRAA